MTPRARQALSMLVLFGVLLVASSAEAGQGWYLLAQPWFIDTQTHETMFGSDFPPSQMAQLGAFESAKACETERVAQQEKATADAWAAAQALTKAQTFRWETKSFAASLASKTKQERWAGTFRCIASDDPRLGVR